MTLDLPKRFSDKVNFTDTCWLWKAAKFTKGYGCYYDNGKRWYSHRFMWTHLNGEIPEGMVICHKCDIPLCVNPDHLFIGTLQDNTNDMISKGRDARGERQGSSKLTQTDVEEIRRLYERGTRGEFSLKGLAIKYGVSYSLIGYVVNKKLWVTKHSQEVIA